MSNGPGRLVEGDGPLCLTLPGMRHISALRQQLLLAADGEHQPGLPGACRAVRAGGCAPRRTSARVTMSFYFPPRRCCDATTIFPGVTIHTASCGKIECCRTSSCAIRSSRSTATRTNSSACSWKAGLMFTIGGEEKLLTKGDMWRIPGNVKHKVVTLDETGQGRRTSSVRFGKTTAKVLFFAQGIGQWVRRHRLASSSAAPPRSRVCRQRSPRPGCCTIACSMGAPAASSAARPPARNALPSDASVANTRHRGMRCTRRQPLPTPHAERVCPRAASVATGASAEIECLRLRKLPGVVQAVPHVAGQRRLDHQNIGTRLLPLFTRSKGEIGLIALRRVRTHTSAPHPEQALEKPACLLANPSKMRYAGIQQYTDHVTMTDPRRRHLPSLRLVMQLVINTFGASLRRKGDALRHTCRRTLGGRPGPQGPEHPHRHRACPDHRRPRAGRAKQTSTWCCSTSTATPMGACGRTAWAAPPPIRRRQLEVADGPDGLELVARLGGGQAPPPARIHRRARPPPPRGRIRLRFHPGRHSPLHDQVAAVTGTIDEAPRHPPAAWKGAAGRAYFACLGRLVPRPSALTALPPTSPGTAFNAMLNYTYGVLYSLVRKKRLSAPASTPSWASSTPNNYGRSRWSSTSSSPSASSATAPCWLTVHRSPRQNRLLRANPRPASPSVPPAGRPAGIVQRAPDQAVRYAVQSKPGRHRNVKRRDVIRYEAHALAKPPSRQKRLPRVVETASSGTNPRRRNLDDGRRPRRRRLPASPSPRRIPTKTTRPQPRLPATRLLPTR